MLPQPPRSDPSLLYRYRNAVCATDALIVAVVELDLLNLVAEQPATIPELAKRLGVAERPLDVVITLLAALGLVNRGETISCTPLARDHLVNSSPFSLRPYYASLRDRRQVGSLLHVMKTDAPAQFGDTQQVRPWVDAMKDEASRHLDGELRVSLSRGRLTRWTRSGFSDGELLCSSLAPSGHAAVLSMIRRVGRRLPTRGAL